MDTLYRYRTGNNTSIEIDTKNRNTYRNICKIETNIEKCRSRCTLFKKKQAKNSRQNNPEYIVHF